jgi:hypothetical protein
MPGHDCQLITSFYFRVSSTAAAAAADAGMLYDNIHNKLFTLPDDTLVMPGHDYKGRSMSSIADEKRLNPRLTKTRQEFINLMHDLNLPHPKQISRALPVNMKVEFGACCKRSAAAQQLIGVLSNLKTPSQITRG